MAATSSRKDVSGSCTMPDVVAILHKNVVNAFPARTICPCAVNQNNIPNEMLLVLRREHAARKQQ